MPIRRKKTGVARTMIWYGDMPALSGGSGQRASGVYPDDPLHGAAAQAAAHADDEVVQVHGGVAVARDQPEETADRGDAMAAARGPQDAVLVAAVAVFQLAVRVDHQHFRHAGVDRVGLVAGIADGAVLV